MMEPRWYNPCGIMRNVNGGTSDHHSDDDRLFVTQIFDQTNIAYVQSNNLLENYTDKLWNMKPHEVHSLYLELDYEWLPTYNQTDIPKKWGERLNPTYLNSLELNETILKVYKYLQTFAVGFEPIVQTDGSFKQEFKLIQDNLMLLLCEIHNVIIDKNLSITNVPRDVMPEFLRQPSDNTQTKTRDWIIYRDYINTLEYIREVFEHFKTTLSN